MNASDTAIGIESTPTKVAKDQQCSMRCCRNRAEPFLASIQITAGCPRNACSKETEHQQQQDCDIRTPCAAAAADDDDDADELWWWWLW
jgi:hypothetical protein